jgi:hypothetical protein
MTTIQNVNCLWDPKRTLESDLTIDQCVALKPGVSKMVSIWHKNDHFVVMVMELAKNEMIVYDGLKSVNRVFEIGVVMQFIL